MRNEQQGCPFKDGRFDSTTRPPQDREAFRELVRIGYECVNNM